MSRALLLGGAGAAALLVAPSVPAAATANLIRNGGFEQPVVRGGGYQLVSTGRSFSGWRVVGAPGNVAPISTTFTQAGIRFVAKAGKQWLDLTGLSNSATGVAQTVKTTPGATYKLSFSLGNVVDAGGTFGKSSTIKVLVNGRRLMSETNTFGTGKQAWETIDVYFTAKTAATTIEFLNGDPRSDSDNGLDAVSLSRR